MRQPPPTPKIGRLHISLRRVCPALLAGSIGVAGCDDPGGPSEPASLEDVDASPLDGDISEDASEVPTSQMGGYDFANGNPMLAFDKVLDATIVLRWTTLITNSWFDAIAPYHPTAIGVYSNLGRQAVPADNTEMNTALLYASYRVLNSLAPQNKADWDNILLGVGLDPNDDHESTTDPIGISNSAGNAVVAARENDGFNQLGFDDGRTYNPTPYADYTGYKPKNTAYKVWDLRKWQPQEVRNAYGITRVQSFVTPQYAITEPYSYDDPSVFSSPKPDKSYLTQPFGFAKYRDQADVVLDVSANLTDEQKMKAELFDDKIRSLGFSAVFASFSQGLTLAEFVQYDFLTNLAAFDTGIAIWQEKTRWDAVRPFTAIRLLYGDDEITAWGGPGQGTVSDITGDEWRPYLQTADHPEYPSGSASFCGAHAEASRLFLGSDNLGYTVPTPAGSSLVEPGLTPAAPLNLTFATWTDFELECGESRIWAGVHFPDSVPAGRDIGHQVAVIAHQFVQDHIDGNVP